MTYDVKLLEPAQLFIDAQELKMQAKIFRTISLLEEFGSNLREPHVKKIVGTNELFELRVQVASNICRLFFFHFKNKVYVITSGYVKKENKTNPREIARAIRLMIEVKEGDNR
jgi:phage-related protein